MDKPQKKEGFAVGGKNGGFFAEGENFLGGFAVGEKNLLSSPDLGGPSMVGGVGGWFGVARSQPQMVAPNLDPG